MTTNKPVILFELVKRLPKELKPEYFDALVGGCFQFTVNEADLIVKAANIIVSKGKPSVPAKVFKNCRAFKFGKTCGNKLESVSSGESGFCETCYHPAIVSDYAIYDEHRKDGYTREEAARFAGID